MNEESRKRFEQARKNMEKFSSKLKKAFSNLKKDPCFTLNTFLQVWFKTVLFFSFLSFIIVHKNGILYTVQNGGN